MDYEEIKSKIKQIDIQLKEDLQIEKHIDKLDEYVQIVKLPKFII